MLLTTAMYCTCSAGRPIKTTRLASFASHVEQHFLSSYAYHNARRRTAGLTLFSHNLHGIYWHFSDLERRPPQSVCWLKRHFTLSAYRSWPPHHTAEELQPVEDAVAAGNTTSENEDIVCTATRPKPAARGALREVGADLSNTPEN